MWLAPRVTKGAIVASKNPDAVADATTEDAVDKAPKRRATKTAKSAKPATKAAAKAPKKAATPELTPGEEAAPAPKRTRKAINFNWQFAGGNQIGRAHV